MRKCTLSLVAVVVVSLASCGDNFEGPPDAPPRPECHDGKDNDEDGLIDFPDDPGCAELESDQEDAPIRPACSDGRDNDRDGKKDWPDDPGCIEPQHDLEDDDCPGGPFCPMCANGVDDDGSGRADYPADVNGCDFAADNFEYAGSSQACGNTLTLKQLPPSGTDEGMLDAMSTSNISTPCLSASGVPAVGYVMVLSKPKVVAISTFGSEVDTVLDLRKAPCMDTGSEITCNDNVGGGDSSSRIVRPLGVGVYYIIVSAKTPTSSGMYKLNVEKFKGEGELCTLDGDCGPGLVCRIPVGGTQKICTKPVCSDGLDDDGDGDIDHPADPGCDSPDDPDEVDDCPSGPNCPDCSNGVDDDTDGNTDYPMDTSCQAASDASEACVTSESILPITQSVTNGDTTTAVNDYDPTCNSFAGMANDLLYRLDLPQMQSLNIIVNGFDTVQSLLNSTCGGTPINCNDFPPMIVSNLAAGTYYLTVEGWSTTNGPFSINTSGVIAPGGSCEGVLYQNGVITCPTGFTCDGPTGAKKCSTQCSDGIDNNGDGEIDYPNDPGCSAPNDNAEDTVCPGPMCPACADGNDNDMDGQTDYPMDTSCTAAGGTSESCVTTEAIGQITTAVTMGTTAGQTNDHDPICNSTTGNAPDVIYSIDLPAMAAFNVGVSSSFDGVHSLLDSACTNTLVCNDFPPLVAGNLAAGKYFLSIDGWFSGSGTFTLTVSGQIAAGGSCEGTLAQAGAITCQPGFTCDGPVGARTCRTQCTDGIDNNMDGTFDYPNDPGCSSPADNNENTVCPGPMCPVCADGLDNDMDGNTDYPMDLQCLAAGGSSESCITSEAVLPITGTTTTGSTAGLTNDYKPVCGFQSSHTAPDVMYQLDVPQMQTLSLNLTGFDGAHSLLDSLCSPAPIACSDPSLMTVNGVNAGTYYVVVDGWSGGQGPYTLTTTGVIAPGGSCETPLFTSGSFVCPTGMTCQGPVGSRRCVSQCSDGVDNNSDGKIDFPFDPGCTSLADNTETTVCPGGSCPVCSNTSDDDADTLTDFPTDHGCSSAAGTSEVFCSIEPTFAGVITMPTTNGTLASPATGNYNLSCQTNTGHDVALALSLPVAVQQLRIDTVGSTVGDTVLSLRDTTCSTQLTSCVGTSTACCNDDLSPGVGHSRLIANNMQPGNYAILVDAYNSNGANNGPFKLNVEGTVAPGTACTSPLFASGVLVCGGNTTCTAGVCQ